MEVHAHTHTVLDPDSHRGRKKWTHYFWEFLMLFLAVFCGFLAENQREHMIEHKREKKYMETLLEDLIRDTADLHYDIIFWDSKIRKLDTIKAELNKKPAERNEVLLYRCMTTMSSGNSFLYHDRTVSQLKNSGNFRLIRKNNISDSLANYDAYINNTLRPVMQNFRENRIYYLHMQNRFFNSEYFVLANQPHLFDSAVASRPDIIAMRNRDEDLFFEYCNELNGIADGYWFLNVMNRTLIRRASNLINLIKKEYYLK